MPRYSRQLTRTIEKEAWRLRVDEGLSHQGIADRLSAIYTQSLKGRNISRSTITKALHRVEQRLLEEMGADVLRLKLNHTARLEQLYQECQTALAESREPHKTVMRIEREQGDAKYIENRQEVTGGRTDLAAIRQMQDILEDIRDIWGANEPKSFTGMVVHRDVSELSDDELAAFIVEGKALSSGNDDDDDDDY